MSDEPKKKPVGRPPTGKKSSKPNITIPDCLQKEAMEIAERNGIGYSQWVSLAIAKEVARSQDAPPAALPQAKPQSSAREQKSDPTDMRGREPVKKPIRHNSRC